MIKHSKNPYPCRNHTFLNQVCHQGLEITRPQALRIHLVGKCAISAWLWFLAFIPWVVMQMIRNIRPAMQKSHTSTHHLSALILSWSWDNTFWPIFQTVSHVRDKPGVCVGNLNERASPQSTLDTKSNHDENVGMAYVTSGEKWWNTPVTHITHALKWRQLGCWQSYMMK